jgi:hypothetical protein
LCCTASGSEVLQPRSLGHDRLICRVPEIGNLDLSRSLRQDRFPARADRYFHLVIGMIFKFREIFVLNASTPTLQQSGQRKPEAAARILPSIV